jgi:alpha-N-arabinofuranosidase
MYSNAFPGSVPVVVGGNAPQPEPKYTVGGDQPRQNSGSPTYPLDVYAALSHDRKTLNVAVVNATESAQTLDLELTGAHAAGSAKLLRLEGSGLSAANKVGKPAELAVKETTASEPMTATTVPPTSVSIFSIPLL